MENKFVFALLFLFMISPVLAFDFDNTYEYNPTTNTAYIHNCDFWIGTCFSQGEVLAEATLVWGDTQVGVGEDIHVGTFNYTPFTNTLTDIQDIDLVDLKNDRTMTRGKQYKIKTYKEEDKYILSCTQGEWNGTGYSQDCEEVEDGKITLVEWKPLSNPHTVLIANTTYEIGVFVDTEEGDYGDWIPTFAGVKIEEWSEWNASLETGLYSAYKLDSTTGDAIDWYAGHNLTEQGTVPSQTGKINNSRGVFSGSNYFSSSDTGNPLNGTTDLTVSFWYYRTANQGSNYYRFLKFDDGTTGGLLFNFDNGASNKIRVVMGETGGGVSVSQTTTSDTPLSNWTHIVATLNGGTGAFKLYVDGSQDKTDTFTDSPDSNSHLFLGAVSGGANPLTQGYIDEVLIWNRELAPSEVTALWNSGNAITYGGESCSASLVNTSWSSWLDNSSCYSNDTKDQSRYLIQYDENNCGGSNTTFYDYQSVSCNYCSYSVVNTSWSSWVDMEVCQTNDYLTQNRSLVEYDSNYASCYAVTGLSSDLWNDGGNETYYEFQEDSCNYCSYSVVNSSWSSWQNQTECLSNDTYQENRSLVEYDSNYASCYAVTSLGSDFWTNITYWEFDEESCDYCTPSLTNTSWSSWVNDTVCLIGDYVPQTRSLIQYDTNNCGEVSNTTYYEYQNDSCTYVACINAPTNTSWSDWVNGSCGIDNLTTQSRYLVTYDLNASYCGNFTNFTTYDYQDVACIYVAPSVSETNQFGLIVDLSQDINRWLLFGALGVAIACLFFKLQMVSVLIFFVTGFIMLFSGINWFFSLLPVSASVIIAHNKT